MEPTATALLGRKFLEKCNQIKMNIQNDCRTENRCKDNIGNLWHMNSGVKNL